MGLSLWCVMYRLKCSKVDGWVGWDGIGSLNAPMLGAPLCGAKNEKTSEKNCDNSSGDNYYE